MPGGDHVVFLAQSFEAGGKIRGFQLKIVFSVSEWTQLSPEKHKVGEHREIIKGDFHKAV